MDLPLCSTCTVQSDLEQSQSTSNNEVPETGRTRMELLCFCSPRLCFTCKDEQSPVGFYLKKQKRATLQQKSACLVQASELWIHIARVVPRLMSNQPDNRISGSDYRGWQRWACSRLCDYLLLGWFKCQIIPECISTG